MTQAHADSARYFNRGTDQSAQMRPGGSSGLELSLAGHRSGDAIFEYDMNGSAYLWFSTEYDTNNAWFRYLNISETAVARSYSGKDFFGFSVRCLKD